MSCRYMYLSDTATVMARAAVHRGKTFTLPQSEVCLDLCDKPANFAKCICPSSHNLQLQQKQGLQKLQSLQQQLQLQQL